MKEERFGDIGSCVCGEKGECKQRDTTDSQTVSTHTVSNWFTKTTISHTELSLRSCDIR